MMLAAERSCLERLLPGLDAALVAAGMNHLEHAESVGIRTIKHHGGPRLCIPRRYGGVGATASEVLRVQRAIASRAPSAAVAVAMHHFTIATLVELSLRTQGLEWLVLEAIAKGNLLVASGFAEGDPNGKILHPKMTLERGARGYMMSGVKCPCSLSKSMDLISVSLVVPSVESDGDRLAVALIPATAAGLTVDSYWRNEVLGAAETGKVTFDRVVVDAKMLSYSGPPNSLDDIQTRGMIWFQAIIAASYLGIASALAERVIAPRRIGRAEGARLGIELEGAMVTLDGMAAVIESGEVGEAALARALFGRYAVQQAVERAASLAFELTGGRDFASSGEASYLIAAARGLCFHPPSRPKMMEPLGGYLEGRGLHEV
jgi:alkylation response protein AidB-like acyl-CoA dehydrogenase